MKQIMFILIFLLAPGVAFAGPVPMDFAYGALVTIKGDGALFEFDLPFFVYETVADPHLGDIRVFNGDKQVVPHTLLTTPPREKKTSKTYKQELKPVPLFPVFSASQEREDPVSVHIETNGKGAVLDVFGGKVIDEDFFLESYILDMSALEKQPLALKLAWTHESSNFVTNVDIFSSNDLSKWIRIVSKAALADIEFGGHRLFRDTISLSGRGGKYLKLTWPKGRENIQITSVDALFSIYTGPGKFVPKRKRRNLDITAFMGEHANQYLFDSSGLFPIDLLNVKLPQNNTLVKANIFCRATKSASWNLVYSGLLYDLIIDKTRLANENISVSPELCRYWRIDVESGGGGLGSGLPVMTLEYLPHKLCFVARGNSPFTLAFGNYKIRSDTAHVDPLLAGLSIDKKQIFIKSAHIGEKYMLAGIDALTEPEPPLPWRRIILWIVLVAGVLIVGLMAFLLFRQMSVQSRG